MRFMFASPFPHFSLKNLIPVLASAVSCTTASLTSLKLS